MLANKTLLVLEVQDRVATELKFWNHECSGVQTNSTINTATTLNLNNNFTLWDAALPYMIVKLKKTVCSQNSVFLFINWVCPTHSTRIMSVKVLDTMRGNLLRRAGNTLHCQPLLVAD